MSKKKICAVIVTYNREKYLIKLLNSLKNQSLKLDSVFIFDNCSNDYTANRLKSEGYVKDIVFNKVQLMRVEGLMIFYYRNKENLGGSGGFHEAIKMVSKLEYDYLWCMDDYVLPDEHCLEKLLLHMSEETRICIPSRTDDNFRDFAVTSVNMSNPFKYSIVSRKRIIYNESIKDDTIDVVDMPFEGPLIDISLVNEIGLPKKEFFIIFDDSEYAMRACRVTKIKYCKDAILHKQIIPQKKNNEELMNWKNYYGFRNQIWFDRHYGVNKLTKILRPRLLMLDLTLRAVVKRKISNIRVIKKAYKDGMNDILGKTVIPGTKGKDI